MMVIHKIATNFTILISALAGTSALSLSFTKRAEPSLTPSIDTSDPLRGGKLVGFNGAMSNALELLNYAVLYPNPNIFAKYFDPVASQSVHDVFRRLLGPDKQTGAPELANIQIHPGEPADDGLAELAIDKDPEFPPLILSEDAFVYPNINEIDKSHCDVWADEGMTLDMYPLGSILLHEYVPWDWFLQSIHHGEVEDQDQGYGWEGVRKLDKNKALYNADSYAWYATELFWSIICDRDQGFEDGDGD